MNSTTSLSFRYREIDYVRAVRAHHAQQLRLPVDILVVLVLIGAGGYLWRSPGMHWLGVGCVAVGVLFVTLLVSAFTVIPVLMFRREPKFRDEYSLTFSPDGIHFSTAHIDSQLQWSIYSRALVDAHSYLLYYGSRQFSIIPRRVFQTADQRQAFEQLLTTHISQIVRKDV